MGVAILISDRAHFRARKGIVDIEGSPLHESITILNVYALYNRASKYVRPKPIELQREIDESTNAINQPDKIDICRPLHPTTAYYTFFSSSHGTFTKIDHILAHKIYLNKLKRIKIIQCMLLDHNGIKLEIPNKKITGGNSLAVQWLGLQASIAGGMGSIPGRGIKIPQAARHSPPHKKR